MKKTLIITGIVIAIAAAVICTGHATSEYYVPPVAVKTSRPAPTPTPEPEITPTPTPDYITEAKKNAPKPVTEREYVNYECGYKITFPESWMGWLLIDDTDAENMFMVFYGKSDAGRYVGDYFGGYTYGWPIFVIFTHEDIHGWAAECHYDSWRKIGTARGKDYYLGYTLAGILGWFEYMANDERNTPEERELTRQDDVKYHDMIGDTAEGGFLDLTFEEIK